MEKQRNRKRTLTVSAILLAVISIFTLLGLVLEATQASDEIAALHATAGFSTATPKSGDTFTMDIRVNSASLGMTSGIIENLHVWFDLPPKLSVVTPPASLGDKVSLQVSGSRVDIYWIGETPIGAQRELKLALAWDAGTTVQGTHKWNAPAPVIHAEADNCISTIALAQDGVSPVPGVLPQNNAPLADYIEIVLQEVYPAFWHTATVRLHNEHRLGGLNLHDGQITIDADAAADIAAIRLGGASIPFTELANTPSAGRKTIMVDLNDATLTVLGEQVGNILEIIYKYPRPFFGDPPDERDMFVTYAATRENGGAVNETKQIHELVPYKNLNFSELAEYFFTKESPPTFSRIPGSPLTWTITFSPRANMQNVALTDNPLVGEPDFFVGFRFSNVKITAKNPLAGAPPAGRVQTRILYQTNNNPSWAALDGGAKHFDWSGASLESAVLGLASGDYVTQVKFEFFGEDGNPYIPAQSGDVAIELSSAAQPAITDTTTPYSYNTKDPKMVSNTIVAQGELTDGGGFSSAINVASTNTSLTANIPSIYPAGWDGNPARPDVWCKWFYATGTENTGMKGVDWQYSGPDGSGWGSAVSSGDWSQSNMAKDGNGQGYVRIGEEAWALETWGIEGGNLHDPIVYFYVPDPNIEILGVETGRSFYYTDVEYFDAPGGGHIVKFRLRNGWSGVPYPHMKFLGNPMIDYPEPGWDEWLPEAGWGSQFNIYSDIAVKLRFNPGAQSSAVSGNIVCWISSGDPEQRGAGWPYGSLASTPLVAAGAAEAWQYGWVKGFGYNIDTTGGLNPEATVSKDGSTYQQIETIGTAPVDVYLKAKIENPAEAGYENLTKVRLIDMLPKADDTMAITNVPKGSTGALANYRVEKILLNGTEIPLTTPNLSDTYQFYYSTTATCFTNRSELRDVDQTPPGHWTLFTPTGTPGEIPSTAVAVMVEKTDGLQNAGDTLEIILKATAPYNSQTKKYWHSISAGGRDNTANLVPGEPLKAGFTVLGDNYMTVSGRIWDDLNRDGLQQGTEPGCPEIEVRLYTADGTQVDMAITGSNGEYAFSGDYAANSVWQIRFDLPGNYVLTKYHEQWPAMAAIDSDFILYEGGPVVFFTVNANQDDIGHLDGGIYLPGETPPAQKNAYINEAPDPENGEEGNPAPVEIGDKITYEIDVFNTTSGDTGPYDIVFALDWSASMNSQMNHSKETEEGGGEDVPIAARLYARDLILDISKDLFDVYPDSRVSVMGMNCGTNVRLVDGIWMAGNNEDDPENLFLQVDTDFAGKGEYEQKIRHAFDYPPVFDQDDNAQFLAAAIDKMVGDNSVAYGANVGTPTPPSNGGPTEFDPERPYNVSYHVKAREPEDMGRTPIIVLISDFQMVEFARVNNPLDGYWSEIMKDQSDRFYNAFLGGVLVTVRMDYSGNRYSIPGSSPVAYVNYYDEEFNELMETYVSPRGHEKWGFWKADGNALYPETLEQLESLILEKATPPTVVTDVVPLGLDIDLGSISPSYGVYDPDTRTVTWSLVDEPPGPIPLSFDTTVAEAGLYENTAYVNEEPTNTTYHEAEEIVFFEDCLLLLTKSSDVDVPLGSGTCDVGDTVTYNVNVRNAGNLDAVGAVFTDQLAPGMDYVPNTAKINNVPVPPGNVDYTDDGVIRTLTIDLGNIPVGGSCNVSFQVLVNGNEIAESESLKYLNQAVVLYHGQGSETEMASYSNVHEIGLELRPYRGTITDYLPEGLTIVGHDDGGADHYEWDAGDRTVTWTWDEMPVGTTTVRVRVEVTEARELYKNQAFFTIEDEEPVPTNFTYHTCLMELVLHIRQIVLSPLSGLPLPVMGYYALSNEGNTLPLTSDSVSPGYPFTPYTLIPGDVKVYALTDIVPQYYEFAGHIQNDGDDPIDHRPEVPGATIDLTANGDIELDYEETDEIWITVYITPKGTPGNQQTGVESNKFGTV